MIGRYVVDIVVVDSKFVVAVVNCMLVYQKRLILILSYLILLYSYKYSLNT